MLRLNGETVNAFESTTFKLPIPLPNNFDFDQPELWSLWKNRFERYIRIANLMAKTEAEKIDILCYTMGIQSEAILLQIMPDTKDKTLADVVQVFTDYFCPNHNLMLKRGQFRSRIQKPGESVDQFITALNSLAEPCQYGTMKNELIRDGILIGLSNRKFFEKLQFQPYISLENIIAMARQAEIEPSQREVSNNSPQSFDTNWATQENDDRTNSDHIYSTTKRTIHKPGKGESSKHSNGASEIIPPIGSPLIRDQQQTRIVEENDSQHPPQPLLPMPLMASDLGEMKVNKDQGRGSPKAVKRARRHTQRLLKFRDLMDQKNTKSQGNDMDESESALIAEGIREHIDVTAHQESSREWLDNIMATGNACIESDTKSVDSSIETQLTVRDVKEIVQNVLDNITPQNFDVVINQISALRMDSIQKLGTIINLIRQKAISESSSGAMCALMCKKLAKMQVSHQITGRRRKVKNTDYIPLGKLMVIHCKKPLEKWILKNEKKMKTIEECADPDQKKLLQELMKRERERRIKYFGHIQFIGELFEVGIVTSTMFIYKCIDHLLAQMNDESLECLCKLLCIVGKRLEEDKRTLNSYFKRISNIVNSEVRGTVSTRVCCTLLGLIELRKNNWVQTKSNKSTEVMNLIDMEAETECGDWATESGVCSELVENQPHHTVNTSDDERPRETPELKYTVNDSDSNDSCDLTDQMSMEKIYSQLLAIMYNKKEDSVDNICGWISANVGEKVSEPEFIKVLMAAILEVSIEPHNDTWRFRVDKFHNQQALIPQYIDSHIKLSELQCLIAIQEYIRKLEDPLRVLLEDIEQQIFERIISPDISHSAGSDADIMSLTRKSAALIALKSFFTPLKKVDNHSSGNEAQGRLL